MWRWMWGEPRHVGKAAQSPGTYTAGVIPHVAPPVWPSSVRQGRFASTIVQNTTEMVEDRGAQAQLKKCRVALLGIPDDTGVELNHGRAGAKMGPHALRQALTRYGAAAPLDEPKDRPAFPRVFDAGDVVVGADIDETHERVTEATEALLEMGLFPIAIGGGHDLTFPFVRGVARVFGPLTGVYFDAHLDVRPEAGSGMSFRALLENGLARKLHCLGVDPLSNTREHFEYFKGKGGSLEVFEAAKWPGAAAGAERQFVSLDMDVIDMAYAPGVSAMNPCGWSPERIAGYVEAAGRCEAVKCFDIMELNPAHDADGRTARLAAHLLLRFLRAFAERDVSRSAGGRA